MSLSRPDPPGRQASLEEWLRWQESLHPQAIELGLDRVRTVASRLALPATGIFTVTVGGTNGKGSSAMLLHEIYRAAGYKTGLYASPHLYRYNERVRIDGTCVSDEALCQAFAAVEEARRETALTYFEFGTLAALWLFREGNVRVQVLEVGLGGRLDAVNLVDPDVALLTNVGLDHTEWLGPDRESIGREKAGIFRAGRPAVWADPESPPQSVQQAAADRGLPLWRLGCEFGYSKAGDAWNWRSRLANHRKLPPPALPGEPQYWNAAGAIAAITLSQTTVPVPEAAVRTGLARARLPGRFERRGDLILDVAHNAEAGVALAANLRLAGVQSVVLVLGMLADKPVERFCAAIKPFVREAFFAGLPGVRGLDGATLARRARMARIEGTACADVAAALREARDRARPGEPILVCGSFLTVAAAGVTHG